MLKLESDRKYITKSLNVYRVNKYRGRFYCPSFSGYWGLRGRAFSSTGERLPEHDIVNEVVERRLISVPRSNPDGFFIRGHKYILGESRKPSKVVRVDDKHIIQVFTDVNPPEMRFEYAKA